MRLACKCFAIVVALACINPGVHPLRAQEQTNEARLLKRIHDVLNSTVDEAPKWDDKGVAARTLAQIADLLWDVDRDNAKDNLKAAWTTTAKVEDPKRELSKVVNTSVRNSVRREVLLIARKRAPELATIWLEEMVEESKSTEKKEGGAFDDRSARAAVLLQMANELVADDPKAAAELLVESLRDGVSFNFQNTLLRMQQRDSALAETVFRAALARLKAAGMSDPNELLTLYSYLYTPGMVFVTNTTDNRNQTMMAIGGVSMAFPPSRRNPAMAREFLELASDLLLSAPGDNQLAARSIVSAIGTLIREVTEQLPEKAALLRARAQQLDAEARFSTAPVPRRSDMPEVRRGESRESFAERRVDLLEESAAKGRDVLTRDIGYATAAVATTVERYQRGLDLTGKIEDKVLREGVRSWLLFRAVLHFIKAANLDEAHRLNLKNDDLAQRAVGFVVGAQKFVRAGNTTIAGEWLREAGALVRKIEANENAARIALGIVSTYGRFDNQLALEWLLYAVKLMRKSTPASLNEDQAPASKRISGITPITDLTSNTSGFSLQSAVAALSPDQFEHVLYVLNDITPDEARGVAVFTLCSTYLKTMNAPKKLSVPQ